MDSLFERVLYKAKSAKIIVIVGAGGRGKDLLLRLEKKLSNIKMVFFDNNENLIGSKIQNIEVVKPYKIEEQECIYIISVDAEKQRYELRNQLRALGIESDKMVTYCLYKDYDYLSNLEEKFCKDEVQDMFFEKFKKKINWDNPITYNEKINWEKFNIKDSRRTRLADKLLVRDWVKEQIGEKYLTKLYGVWDDANDINFNLLPDSFALKLNNGSDRNIIVKNKSIINQLEVCEQLNKWKCSNYAYTTFEMHYKDIVPKILCEEYLEGMAENVYDYNIYCFHGEPKYIWCIKGSHKPWCQASFYNEKWEMQPFSYGYPKDPILAPKPNKLDEMLELSKVLCKDFAHVRVDWYNLLDGRVLFGEMTFSTWGGLARCPCYNRAKLEETQ